MKKIKFFILPVLCIIAGLAMSAYITSQYVDDCRKANWPSATAIVLDLTSYEKSGVHNRTETFYVIKYRYEVDGISYDGEFQSKKPMLTGNSFEIKYNPETPDNSTTVTKPDTGGLVFVLAFGLLFIIDGAFFIFVIYKSRFYLCDETEYKAEQGFTKQKRNIKTYLGLLIPISVFVLAVVLMYFQPFAQKSISADEFIQILNSDGYEAEASSERLQQEFGFGSLIESAYSVNTANLRIDFCELNTSHNAKLLFDSAALPEGEQIINDKYIHANQSDEYFYAKAWKNNTFVYAACKLNDKADLLQILKEMEFYS